eukprot:4461121-Pyramimonas_sp.AAC.1
MEAQRNCNRGAAAGRKSMHRAAYRLHICGRAHGLKDMRGHFMKEPWAAASSSKEVTNGLHGCRDSMHTHLEARLTCKPAEEYTDALAELVHVVLTRASAA